MMAKTDKFSLLIPWYATGSLEPGEGDRVEKHLRHCSACRGLLEMAETMREAADRLDGHLSTKHLCSEDLRRFAEEPETLVDARRREIEAHLRGCAMCDDTHGILVHLHRECNEPIGDRDPFHTEPSAGFLSRAATALSKALLGPRLALAYLVLLVVTLPLVTFQLLEPPRRSSKEPGWSGRVDGTLLVGDSVRGEAETVVVYASEGQSHFLVTIEPNLFPSQLDRASRYRLQIIDPTGRAIWSHDLRGDEVTRDLDSTMGLPMVLVPAFPLGRYDLRFFRVDRRDETTEIIVPFELRIADHDGSASPSRTNPDR